MTEPPLATIENGLDPKMTAAWERVKALAAQNWKRTTGTTGTGAGATPGTRGARMLPGKTPRRRRRRPYYYNPADRD